MTATQARAITSNQDDVHEDLAKMLARHQHHEFQRPIAEHTKRAFESMIEWLQSRSNDLIIDACCGVGESTYKLAMENPNACVIGVDKSIARIDKHAVYATNVSSENSSVNNYLLLQADLNDFWRLLFDYTRHSKPTWRVIKQVILYPNPYPKKSQLGKRWHASAIFPSLIGVCENIELRSNWRVYVDEFLQAARYYGLNGTISQIYSNELTQANAYTPFERKYLAANQTCIKLVIRPLGFDKK